MVSSLLIINYRLKRIRRKKYVKIQYASSGLRWHKCHASESDAIVCNLRDELEARADDSVQVIMTGCFGFCEKGRL